MLGWAYKVTTYHPSGKPRDKWIASISENKELVAIQKGGLREMKNLQFILMEQGVVSLISGVDAVYDKNAQVVTCLACAYGFVPTTSECPDCGMVLA